MKNHITLAELKLWLQSNKNIRLLDVRSKEEFLEKHIPEAEHVPIEWIESGKHIPESDQIIITLCGKGGGRSERAADYFRKNLNNEVYFLAGGTQEWFS